METNPKHEKYILTSKHFASIDKLIQLSSHFGKIEDKEGKMWVLNPYRQYKKRKFKQRTLEK